MRLTSEEKIVLDGAHGEVMQRMMALLVAVGEAFDAAQMVPVSSVHVPAVSISTLRRGGKELFKEIASSGAGVKTFTTVNPSSVDTSLWQELGIPETDVIAQSSVTEIIRSIGAIPTYTCTPYLVGNLPRFGQHIAWGEASAVIFANSVLGARTNPEGGPSALASALTGKTPLYGLHLEENRQGKILIRVKIDLTRIADYGALGYWTGNVCHELIPVFTGISPHVTIEALKMLSNGIACICSPAMFHAVGITPEALSEEQALGNREPTGILEFGGKELEEAKYSLGQSGLSRIDWVAFGCPHCSIAEIKNIASQLDGKRVSPNVELWVCTSRPVKYLSDRMHFTKIIERAGGRILCDTCPVVISKEAIREKGFQSVATDSAAMATYISAVPGVLPHFGKLEKCIDAAMSGSWQ